LENKADIFIGIIEDHKGIIYKITNSYCKASEDRKDLNQEIIVQLWQSFDKYNSQYSLSTWIYRIALNTSISFYRKNRTKQEKTIELSAIIEISLNAEEPFQEDQNLVRLQSFIQELKEIDKAVVLLYLEGLSQKQIAEIIGISASNVGTKISRIKTTLYQKFKAFK